MGEKQELYEMSRIGYTDDKYEIYVNTDDGNIPHFHYRKGTYGNYTFHTCIRLDVPKYFHHDGKEDVLNTKQRKELYEFLQVTHKTFKVTMWKVILALWNDNNSDIQIDEDTPMPNYLELE